MLDDAGALFQRVARDPEVTKYLLWALHPDVAATRRVITEKINVSDDERTWAIELKHSGEIIGLTSCRRPVPHSVEIGYCLGRRWWGKGFMSEALDMLMTALEPIATCTASGPPAASTTSARRACCERAGFVLEGRLARHAVYPTIGPEPQDGLLYAKILR